MGRLPALISVARRVLTAPACALAPALALALALAGTGCERDAKDVPAPPTTSRSNAVVVPGAKEGTAASPTSPTLPTTTPASSAAAAHPAPTAAPRQLCVGQTPRPAPKGAIRTEAATGAQPLPASIPFGVGKWVWINLWAAWCGPCKEEMPRLIAWQKKLSATGVLLELSFVSIDDDRRQLQRFLADQPADNVRASYWLPEGAGRSSFLGALGLKESTDLPAHALVAPSGQLACVIQGVVEERDFPSIAAFLGAKR